MSAFRKTDPNICEELDWKEYALPLPEPSAPIVPRVMSRVRAEGRSARAGLYLQLLLPGRFGRSVLAGRSNSLKQFMPLHTKKLLPALIAVLLLGASLSAYAADKIMELRNKDGIVILTAEKPAENDPFAPYAEQYSRLLAPYYYQVMDELKPGDAAAYYVNNDIINSLETTKMVNFAFKPINYDNLNALRKAAEAANAPAFPTLSSLPKGWRFQSGSLSLKDPYLSMTPDEYKAYTDKFIQEAKELPSGEAVVMKRIEWKESDVVNLHYVNGKFKLVINVMKLQVGNERRWEGKPINKGPWNMTIQSGSSSEVVTLNGISALYAAAIPEASEKPDFGNELTWFDETNNTIYRMQDFINAPLGRKQFLAFAEI